MAKHRFPIFPVKPLLKYKFPSNTFISTVQAPITIFHGTDDRVVPYTSGKKLAKINSRNLDFITIEGGYRNNLIEFEAFRKGILAVLR